MTSVRRIIIDMDGGIDDALALIFALRSREVEVVGITSVSGNVQVGQATNNALRVVELLGRPDVWVAAGSEHPLSRNPIRAFDFHGRDGLGDSHLPLPKLRPSAKKALVAMRKTLASSKRREIAIVCTGPLTNLATLVSEFQDAKRMIGEVVIMGGAYGITENGVGNETPVAEFNIYSDPEAAKIVFESGIGIRAVGLDVTTIPSLELERTDYARIKMAKGRVAEFASRILRNNIRLRGRFSLHDPMAVGACIRPALYRFSKYPVTIETKGQYTTGMTVTDRRDRLSKDKPQGSSVKVCESVELGFKRLFLDRLIVA